MRALIRKEWREHRALIIGFLVLAPALSLVYKDGIVTWEKIAAADSLGRVIPVLLGLFLVAIGSDLVAGDASSGRMEFLAALPVRASKLWAARALFLFGSAVLYLAYLLVVESAFLALAGKDWLFWEGTRVLDLWLAVVTIGAATFFYSTLLDRGFAAIVAAIVSVGGLWVLLAVAGVRPPTSWTGARAIPNVASLLLVGCFLTGSYLAFTRGRIHLRTRLRRICFAAAGFLAFAALPVAIGAKAEISWHRPELGTPGMRYTCLATSEDGRKIAVSAGRWGFTPLGRYSSTWEFFEIDVGAGTSRVVDRPVGSGTAVYLGGKLVMRPYDLARRMAVPAPWVQNEPTADWGTAVCRRVGRSKWESGVFVEKTGRVIPLPSQPILIPPDPDGAALCSKRWGQGIRVLRVPLAGGEPEEILTGRRKTVYRSPDGRHAFLALRDGAWLLRAEDASARKLEDVPSGLGRVLWSPGGQYFLAVFRDAGWHGDTATGAITRFDLPDGVSWGSWPTCFDGRTFFVGGDSLVRVGVDGSVERILPPPDSPQSGDAGGR